MLKPRIHPLRPARGVALIEVLVSVLLLAVGILGVIGLQSTLVQASTDNRMRATATLMAGEVMSSMWVGTATSADLTSYSGPLPASHPSAARITSTLPLGTATVTGGAGGTMTVVVSWKMPNESTPRSVTQVGIVTSSNVNLPP